MVCVPESVLEGKPSAHHGIVCIPIRSTYLSHYFDYQFVCGSFELPKQRASKRFLLCLQTDYADCDCKGTTKFAHLQEKSHFSAIFYSAGYRRAQDKWRVLGVGTRETGIRRAEDREHGTGKVLDGDTVVTEWYRNSNEVVSRKIAGKKHIEGRMKVRGK